jgi:hypothetical protein
MTDTLQTIDPRHTALLVMDGRDQISLPGSDFVPTGALDQDASVLDSRHYVVQVR